MKRKQLITIHICFWLYTFVVLEYISKLIFKNELISPRKFISVLALSNYVLFLSVFYTNYLVALPRLFKKKRYLLYAITCTALAILFAGIRYYIQEIVFLKYLNICNYCVDKLYQYLLNNTLQAISWLILPGIIIWFIDNWMHTEKQKIILLEEKMIAERAFLQSQVNPHFLFNTLNTIYAMVFHQSEHSLAAIKNLSEIMRYSISNIGKNGNSLLTEMEYLKNYIDLQKLRVSNANIEYSADGDFSLFKIEPLLLISFIENAFKHGICNDPAVPLKISIQLINNTLEFIIENKINTNVSATSAGIGLENIRRRLALHYPDAHQLSLRQSDNIYHTTLILKLHIV